MDNLILTKIDLNKYTWKDIPPRNGMEGQTRLLAGGEIIQDILNRYNKGFQTLFFAVNVDLASQQSSSFITRAAREAWIKLRYLVPTIASLTVVDSNDIPSLQYYTSSAFGVQEWADKTFLVHQESSSIDLIALRRTLGVVKVPSELGQQTWMHLSIENTQSVSSVGFMLHTHHSPFDGTAMKILTNIYLKEFAKAVGGEKIAEGLDWGNEIGNLLPAVFNVMLPSEPAPIHPSSNEEPSFHHPFYKTSRKVIQAFLRNGDPGWPITCREEITFSKQESELFMQKLKGSSQSYTVTHAAHAALVMVNIFDNPPTQEVAAKSISCEFIINSRRHLQKPYSTREGYPGYALSVMPHGFPLTMFLSKTGEVLPLDKAMLVQLMQHARDIYNDLKEMPVALSFMIPASDILSPAHPPENSFRLAHDGPGETFLDHTFTDGSNTKICSVTKFFTAVNRTDPAPFFRVSSWGGVLELGADYNSNVISQDDVRAYLHKWKEMMMLVAAFDVDDY
ncbi:hypothetical protein C8R42DRAFT_569634 [Lentinula raphanica]|nr:hypothetical protein C8R42DRAFT_570079 [Lentinula raphanica]KAJ3729808.1 hypothetical protein C8R42DRAFT_569634 [Lentinula raphanica]